MAIKDFGVTENKDLNPKDKAPCPPQDKGTASGAADQESSDAIKNAHAAGDGSFGRSESSLPEEEPQQKPTENPY